MKCVVCKVGETIPGEVTVTLEQGDTILVIKGVPARVCANCGEEYLDEQTTARILGVAEETAQKGVQVDVRKYQAA